MANKKQIEEKVIELEKTNKQVEELGIKQKELKSYILEQFDTECTDEFIVDDGAEKVLSAKLVESTKINFDYDAILEKLPKDKLETIVEKQFVIFDQEKFKEIVKANPNLKGILQEAIKVEKVINTNKLDYAFQRGIINEDDLQGFYTTNITRSMRLTRKKRFKE